MAPELLEKKKLIMERLPLNYKKYKKNYEYKNNQFQIRLFLYKSS